jgi:hypothetical protein
LKVERSNISNILIPFIRRILVIRVLSEENNR